MSVHVIRPMSAPPAAPPEVASPTTWDLMESRLVSAQVDDLLGTAIGLLDHLLQDVELTAGPGEGIGEASRLVVAGRDAIRRARAGLG